MSAEGSKLGLQSVGNYDILHKIAEGGMGTVYKAKQRETGAIVALKVLRQQTANNAVVLRRFEQEFRAASRLDHPNIVRALDYGQTGKSPYLVMEYVDGETLGKKIGRDGPLPVSEAIRLI